MKPINLVIPHIETKVEWKNEDLTNIIGMNGSGKTLLLEEMMRYCDEHGMTYTHYNALTALSEARHILEHGNDEDIIYAAKMMSNLSADFGDDWLGWAKAMNGHTFDNLGDYKENIDLIKKVLSMCGNGHTRLFVLTHNAVRAMDVDFYFMDLPETSLHIHLAQVIPKYLMKYFQYTKLVMATHSPDIVSFNKPNTQIITL